MYVCPTYRALLSIYITAFPCICMYIIYSYLCLLVHVIDLFVPFAIVCLLVHVIDLFVPFAIICLLVHYIHCILHVEHGRTWPIIIKVHTCTLHVHIYSHHKKASNQLMLLHVNK